MDRPARPAGLFRSEALEAQEQRLQGEVILAQPRAVQLLVPIFSALMLAAGLFLTSARYARTERVVGYLSSDKGTSALRPPRPGTVSELHVRSGDAVRAGDLLMTVRVESTLADGGELAGAVREQLQRQIEQLEESGEVGQKLFEQAQRQRRQRSSALAEKLRQLESMQRIAQRRLSLAAQREERYADLLASGVVSEDQFQQHRDARLVLDREVEELHARSLEMASARDHIRDELESAPLQHEQGRASRRIQLSELTAKLHEADGRGSYAIKSPVDGQVALLQASVGSAVTPELPVAVLMSRDSRLEATLLVPTRAAGMIEPGQWVGLKYVAFPYAEFGIQAGRLLRIDAAILSPAELQSPVRVDEPIYQATAALDRQDVLAFGKRYPLQVGALLEADIVLEKRSLLEWILEPLYSLRGASGGVSAS